MPGPGPRGVPNAVPNSKGPGTAKSFLSVLPFGQNGVNPAVVSADVGTLTLTGFAPTILTPRTVLPGVGVLTATGLAPTVLTPRVAKPGVGVLTAVGLAPAIVTPRVVRAGLGALTVTGFAPTISVAVVARPGVGSLTLSGFAPVVLTPRLVKPGVGALALAGFAPLMRIGTSAVPGVGALTLTGFAPVVRVGGNALVRPGVGSLVVDGFAPVVTGDPVAATLPAGGWMQPIRRATAQPFTVWAYEGFAPTVVIAPAQRFRAKPMPRPAIAVAGMGALELQGFAPIVAVVATMPVVAPPPEHAPDATGEPAVVRLSPTLDVAVVESGGSVPALRAALPAPDSHERQKLVASEVGPLTEPDASVPAWLASPIVVDVGYATLLLEGLAPTIHVTTRTIPTAAPWSPESEDDAAILWAAYDLLVNA